MTLILWMIYKFAFLVALHQAILRHFHIKTDSVESNQAALYDDAFSPQLSSAFSFKLRAMRPKREQLISRNNINADDENWRRAGKRRLVTNSFWANNKQLMSKLNCSDAVQGSKTGRRWELVFGYRYHRNAVRVACCYDNKTQKEITHASFPSQLALSEFCNNERHCTHLARRN